MDLPQQKDVKAWLAPSLALSFMFCVFAPLEAYFSNEAEYWFRLQHVIPIVGCAFLVLWAVLLLVGVFLGRTRLADIGYSLLLIVLIVFYIQGNYIPRPYGVLNGDRIPWNSPRFRSVSMASVILFSLGFALLAVAVVVKSVARQLRAIGPYVCLAVVGIQLTTLATLYLEKDVFGEGPPPSYSVKADKMFDLGRDHNILVILLDTFDSHILKEILSGDEGKFARGILRDFTYYPDTLGMYPTTRGALPHILTGVAYSNDVPYNAYVDVAFRNNPLYEAFAENGYSVELYTRSRYVAKDFPIIGNIVSCRYKVTSPFAFANALYRLVAFNYLPHQLKSHFVVDGDDFLPFRKSTVDSLLFGDDVLRFYGILKKSAFSAGSHANTFKFYHLAGTHPPMTFGKTLKTDEDGPFTLTDESLGCLTLLKAFLKKLKEGGCYDNSTIVVMADHGYLQYRQNPVFLVKNRGESHPLRISAAKMSYAYFSDSLLDLVRNGTPISEEAINTRAARHNNRTYLYYQWDNGWARQYLPRLQEMRLSGCASLEGGDSLEFTGVEFDGAWEDRGYVLGTPLSFGKKGNASPYLYRGFYLTKGNRHETRGNEAIIRMKVAGRLDNLDNLYLDIGKTRFDNDPPVTLSANSVPLTNTVELATGKLIYAIPPSCIDDSRGLVLRFAIPNVVVSNEFTAGSVMRPRLLSLGFLKISPDIDDGIPRKTNVSFAGRDGAPARKWCFEGISWPEAKHTWTESDKLVMRFARNPLLRTSFALTLRYETFLPKERVVVTANGTEIDNYVAEGNETRRFIVPANCVAANGEIEIVFSFPDAVSPKELDQGGDNRRLAFKLFSMRVD